MVESLDDLTYDVEDETGTLVRKQLERVVLVEGAWATVLFLFQEVDRRSGGHHPPRVAVVRFQKSRGMYRKHSSFNLSTQAQARRLTDTLNRWLPRLSADHADRADETSGEHADQAGQADEDARAAHGDGGDAADEGLPTHADSRFPVRRLP